MANILVRLLLTMCLIQLCLSDFIPTTTSPTPACSPGSGRVQDCMSYYCDDSGQWQHFEFTRTHECCLKIFHPACTPWGITPPDFVGKK